MMQKSTNFTTIFRVKKCHFHYDFACKKVPFSLRYAKKYLYVFKKNSRFFKIIKTLYILYLLCNQLIILLLQKTPLHLSTHFTIFISTLV
jgi:hypothetical protein